MPTTTLRTRTEVEDLIRGLTLMGTGGGGRPEMGKALLFEQLESCGKIEWVSIGDLPDDAWTCSVWGVGSVAPRVEHVKDGLAEKYGHKRVQRPMLEALRQLEEHCGIEVAAIVPTELGGYNTAGAIDAALAAGKALVDGDYAGRAVPEGVQSRPSVLGLPAGVAAIVDSWGDVFIRKSVVSVEVDEFFAKMMSIVVKYPDPTATCAFADALYRVAEVREVVVPGTLSFSLGLGRAIRVAREEGKDPVEAARSYMSGWVLFKGEVVRKVWADERGYMVGTTDLRGTEEFTGRVLRIWYKNENHITWLDGRPFVTSPDIISVVRRDSGEPIINTYLSEGESVAVLGMAHPLYRTEKGLEVLGPRHFGFDLDYVPIEEAVRRLGL